MAMDLCSEKISAMSPRISFSHDLCISDVVPIELRHFGSNSSGFKNSSVDFDFCVFDHESSSADELFSNGKLLPTEIKKKFEHTTNKQVNQSVSAPPPKLFKQNSKIVRDETSKDDEIDEKSQSSTSNNNKSFWRFKRSSSANCGSGYARGLCPLPLLSRSNSTGSTPTSNQPPLSSSSNQKQSSRKQTSLKPSNFQKPPLKKNYGSSSSYGNGNTPKMNHVHVLNVPSGNLFGLASIFSRNKDKNKKRC